MFPHLPTVKKEDAKVYDGDAVLYRNMRIVENAVQAVSDKYENVYFTYINTSK